MGLVSTCGKLNVSRRWRLLPTNQACTPEISLDCIQKFRPLKVDEACAFLGASTIVLQAVSSGCLGSVWSSSN
jgi:hypothetical protein